MGIRANTIYQIDAEEMAKFFNHTMEQKAIDSFCKRFSNTLVTPEDVAKFHNVSVATVINYCKDGLIIPEHREKNFCHYKFRLSEVLKMDFSELKKQLKIRKTIKP